MIRHIANALIAAALCTTLSACTEQPSAAHEPTRPTATVAVEDSATRLYRDARHALERGDSTAAVHGLEQVFMRWPSSPRAAHALYWKAFVLYRRGGVENLRIAHTLLELATQVAPTEYAIGDAATLLLRVRQRLAAAGDRDALREFGAPDVAALATCGTQSADRLAWAASAESASVQLTRLRAVMHDASACSTYLREQALLLLARIPEGASVADLVAAATDSAPAVRQTALRVMPRPAPDAARAALAQVLATARDVTSLETAGAAWASRPDWGTEPLRAFLRRADRNPTAADYIQSRLTR